MRCDVVVGWGVMWCSMYCDCAHGYFFGEGSFLCDCCQARFFELPCVQAMLFLFLAPAESGAIIVLGQTHPTN